MTYSFQNTKILLVEDNVQMLQMLKAVLQSFGVGTVITSLNGEEAFEQFCATNPDLVITDLIMPEMNGYELCRWLKNETKLQKRVPVLICSTKSEEFDRYWGMKQGADAYITKPFQPPELLQAVEKLLQSVS